MVLATKRAVGSEYGYPIQQNTPAQEPKVKARVKKRPSPMVGIALIAIFFMMGISYTFMQAAKAHLIWQVNQVKEANAAMQMDNEKLKLEVAKMKSLDRIESVAVNQLQMVQNPGVEYLAFQAQPAEGKNDNAPAVAAAAGNSSTAVMAGTTSKNNLIESIATVFSKGALDRG